MRIGSSIGLIAVGLILALAVDVDIEGLDLSMIGWILTVVGIVGLVASLAMTRRSRTVVEQPVVREPTIHERPVVREQPVVRDEYPTRRIERREY